MPKKARLLLKLLLLLPLLLLLVGTGLAQQGNRQEWQATYWNNNALAGDPVLTRSESALSHDWGQGSPAEGINPENFSARWTRLLPLPAGRYRFTVTVDDGVRLWVDDELIINSWRVQSRRTLDAEIELAGGDVPVRVEYFENREQALINLSWTPLRVTADAWYGEYFSNRSLSGAPVLVRDDPAIIFDWGQSSPAPDRLEPDTFSARWQQTLSLAEGTYRFQVTVDDGARLWVDERLLIDVWQPQPATSYAQTIRLEGGAVPVRLEYFENGGLAEVSLSWMRVEVGPTATPAPAPVPPPAPAAGTLPDGAETVIVDNGGARFRSGGTPAGDWQVVESGYNGDLRWTLNSERLPASYNWGLWRPSLAPALYEVAVYIPANLATTTQARYWIYHADGASLRIVNQANNNGRWVSLGTFRFDGGDEYVSLTDVTFEEDESTRVAYDAVRWTPVTAAGSAEPAIAVSPQRVSSGERVVVQGSGFPAGQQVFLRLGPPGAPPQGQYGRARTGPDGDVRIVFFMPATWPDGVPVAETVSAGDRLGVLLTTDQGTAALTSLIYEERP